MKSQIEEAAAGSRTLVALGQCISVCARSVYASKLITKSSFCKQSRVLCCSVCKAGCTNCGSAQCAQSGARSVVLLCVQDDMTQKVVLLGVPSKLCCSRDTARSLWYTQCGLVWPCMHADCGAGVGRVAKELLLHVFHEVDLLEPSQHLLEAAGKPCACPCVSVCLCVCEHVRPDVHAEVI
jgi:hypothetical protein